MGGRLLTIGFWIFLSTSAGAANHNVIKGIDVYPAEKSSKVVLIIAGAGKTTAHYKHAIRREVLNGHNVAIYQLRSPDALFPQTARDLVENLDDAIVYLNYWYGGESFYMFGDSWAFPVAMRWDQLYPLHAAKITDFRFFNPMVTVHRFIAKEDLKRLSTIEEKAEDVPLHFLTNDSGDTVEIQNARVQSMDVKFVREYLKLLSDVWKGAKRGMGSDRPVYMYVALSDPNIDPAEIKHFAKLIKKTGRFVEWVNLPTANHHILDRLDTFSRPTMRKCTSIFIQLNFSVLNEKRIFD